MCAVQADPPGAGAISMILGQNTKIPYDKVTLLEGHEDEVMSCQWNPTSDLLATGSIDGTAKIWKLTDSMGGEPVIIQHNAIVMTVAWKRDGQLLLTKTNEGIVDIWSPTGERVRTLEHKGGIIAPMWNKEGNYILSASKTAFIWNAATGQCQEEFPFHVESVYDLSWQNNDSFASCSYHTIHVCKLGCNTPLKTFKVYPGSINEIKWNSAGTLLASCSDDSTVKVWDMQHKKYVHNLQSHTDNAYTIAWSPTVPHMLASGSFDHTVKLWNASLGDCIYTFNDHTDDIMTIAFSPDGKYLASGALDASISVWSINNGDLMRKYKGIHPDGIHDVYWNHKSDKLVAKIADYSTIVLDLQ